MHCAGLETQKNLRDLIQLPKLVGGINWLTPEELENTGELAIICGLWLADDPDTSSRVLLARSTRGYPSLIVPRFTAGDIGPVLQAPSEIRIESADFETLQWSDGSQHNVSGVTYLNTALHSGRLGSIGLGSVVLCYHPHIDAGPILLCTASITGRPSGVKLGDQKELFARILDSITTQVLVVEKKEVVKKKPRAENLAEFLLKTGEQGASFLLVLVAAHGKEAQMDKAAGRLGIRCNKEEMQNYFHLMPEASMDEVRAILKQQGWSAYLRRIAATHNSGETS